MTDDEAKLTVTDLEKTPPVLLLENRRRHLIQWLSDGEQKIAAAEMTIKQSKVAALEMAAEIDAIEKALNVLNKAQEPKESVDA